MLLFAACSEYDLVPSPVDVDPEAVTECGFTRIGTTAYYRYDCNPVFTTTEEPWAPDIGGTAFAVTEVMGHPFYQLWYVGIPDADSYRLGYAVSADGTAWTPHPENPGLSNADAQPFDRTVFQAPQAEWDPDRRRYVMLYGGLDLTSQQTDGGIGVVVSADGQSWARLTQNPVLSLDAEGVQGATSWCWPLDLNVTPEGRFSGYLAGTSRGGPCEAWEFTARDLDDIEVQPEKRFAAGQEGDWDDEGLISLNVATLDGEERLFYVGFGNWIDQGNVRVADASFLGEAVRGEDGSWERNPEPIDVNMTPEGDVSAVAAVRVGDRIALWITDRYGDASAVGYFLYDPNRAAEEDG